MAHRDALGSPALAELSGTAALLEMARRVQGARAVLDARARLDLGRQRAAPRARARSREPRRRAGRRRDRARRPRQPARPQAVDRAVVERRAAPRRWRSGARSSARSGARPARRPGGSRAIGQWARRALPLTVSEQGEAARAGLPAVLLQASGERGPGPRAAVSENRLDALRPRGAARGHRARRAASSRAGDDGPFAAEPAGIVTVRRLLPDWAIRLLVGTLLLPPLLTAIDAFFGARRRRLPVARWIAWVAAARGAVPARLAVDRGCWADRRARRARGARAARRAAARAAGGSRRSCRRRSSLALGLARRCAARSSARLGLPASGRPAAPAAALGLVISGARRASSGCSTRSPPRCWCPPRTPGCSPPRPAPRLRRRAAALLVAARARAAGADGRSTTRSRSTSGRSTSCGSRC